MRSRLRRKTPKCVRAPAQHVDVNIPQPDGSTALTWAAHWNDVETADLLIAAGANANAASGDYGSTPLWEACVNGSAAMA